MVELMVIFALFTILISFVQPALKSVQEKSQRVQCQNQLKQLGTATALYCSDYDNWLPISHLTGGLDPAWVIELAGYLNLNFTNTNNIVAKGTVIDCPSHNFDGLGLHPKYGGYAFNYRYLGWTNRPDLITGHPEYERQKLHEVSLPSQTMYLSDGLDFNSLIVYDYMLKYLYEPSLSAPNLIYDRHQGQFNVLWADFRVSEENWFDIALGKNNDKAWYFKKNK